MSKTALKKEIQDFTADQLRELLLDVYRVSPEARGYLDFFVDPDVDALTEKYKGLLAKELQRAKRGTSKARISHLRKALKTYASYNPGADHVLDLMTWTWVALMRVAYSRYVTDTLGKGIDGMLTWILETADREELFDRTLTDIINIIDHAEDISKPTRKRMHDLVQAYMDNHHF